MRKLMTATFALWAWSVVVIPTVSAQQVGALNFSTLADELLAAGINKGRIAIYPLDLKGSGLSRSDGRLIEDAVQSAIQRRAAALGLTVVARAELTAIYNDKQFTSDNIDFTEIASKAKVNLITMISATRQSADKVSVSAKIVGSSGSDQGLVLGSSRPHIVSVQTKFNVAMMGVFEGADRKQQYESTVLSALSGNQTFNVINSVTGESDFSIRAAISYSISDKQTAEAGVLSGMLGMFGNLPQVGSGQVNPLAGMAKGLQNVGKSKNVTVEVVAEAIDLGNNRKITSEYSEFSEIAFDASTEQQRSAIQELVRKSLKIASEDLVARMQGTNQGTLVKPKSLLD